MLLCLLRKHTDTDYAVHNFMFGLISLYAINKLVDAAHQQTLHATEQNCPK